MHTLTVTTQSLEGTKQLGTLIGRVLRGGEILDMVSDVGGGKTSFTKGLALGLGIDEVIQSPTFTISRLYKGRDGLELHHFDFYRLQEAGVMAAELEESLQQANVVTVVEWGDIIHDILPSKKITVRITSLSEESRAFTFTFSDELSYLAAAISQFIHERVIA